MPGLTCNACNKKFQDETDQKIHYKSKWHRYNLKRKVAGFPGVTEAVFLARQSSLAKEKKKLDETQLMYSCGLCGERYTSSQTREEVVDPSCCFMCDLEHNKLESCMVHMHKQHGFFIPDVEYLKDPRGLLTYIGLKVKRDFMCLYCNDRCHPFSSLEAVRKHMEAKSHCKVHYGDGSEDEEAELEDFYDYSSSYVDTDGKQLIAVDDTSNTVELGGGGSELVITRRNDGKTLTKILGSREFLRYYRQNPRPTPENNTAITAVLTSRVRSMGLATVKSREDVVRLEVMKAMTKYGVEAMRSKIGMKNNVIRKLPKNVPYQSR